MSFRWIAFLWILILFLIFINLALLPFDQVNLDVSLSATNLPEPKVFSNNTSPSPIFTDKHSFFSDSSPIDIENIENNPIIDTCSKTNSSFCHFTHIVLPLFEKEPKIIWKSIGSAVNAALSHEVYVEVLRIPNQDKYFASSSESLAFLRAQTVLNWGSKGAGEMVIITSADVIIHREFYQLLLEYLSSKHTSKLPRTPRGILESSIYSLYLPLVERINTTTLPDEKAVSRKSKTANMEETFKSLCSSNKNLPLSSSCWGAFVFPKKWIPEFEVGTLIVELPPFECVFRALTFAFEWKTELIKPVTSFGRFNTTLSSALNESVMEFIDLNVEEGMNMMLSERVIDRSCFEEECSNWNPLRQCKEIEKLFSPVQEVKNLIFSANTGRTGSLYLSEVFSLAVGITSAHEPRGYTMSNEAMKFILNSPYNETFEKRKGMKLPNIETMLNKSAHYAESNTMFIKTFWDIVSETYKNSQSVKLHVVILRRYLPMAVRSMFELGWMMGNFNFGWYYKVKTIHPENRVLQPLDSPEFEGRLEELALYAMDVEARIGVYKKRYEKEVHMIEVRLEHLQSPISILHFFRQLNLYFNYETLTNKRTVGIKTNRDDNSRFHITVEEVEACIERILLELEKENKPIPILPHMQIVGPDPWIPILN